LSDCPDTSVLVTAIEAGDEQMCRHLAGCIACQHRLEANLRQTSAQSPGPPTISPAGTPRFINQYFLSGSQSTRSIWQLCSATHSLLHSDLTIYLSELSSSFPAELETQFVATARRLSQLTQRSLPRLHDAGFYGNCPFLVFDHVPSLPVMHWRMSPGWSNAAARSLAEELVESVVELSGVFEQIILPEVTDLFVAAGRLHWHGAAATALQPMLLPFVRAQPALDGGVSSARPATVGQCAHLVTVILTQGSRGSDASMLQVDDLVSRVQGSHSLKQMLRSGLIDASVEPAAITDWLSKLQSSLRRRPIWIGLR
jgi:hypothetical protein